MAYTKTNWANDNPPPIDATNLNKIEDMLEELDLRPSGSKSNLIINGNFQVNQRAKTGTVVLTAGQYGHDRFKAGASGCTYTFATVQNITTLTISAGSLIQVVEGLNLESGDVCLSWIGTAQGKIGAGSYGASGVVGTAVGGTNLNIEFNTGTLSKVVLVQGNAPQSFVLESYKNELHNCQRYFVRYSDTSNANAKVTLMGNCAATTIAVFYVMFANEMRIKPTVSFSSLQIIDTSSGLYTVSSISTNDGCTRQIGIINASTTGLTINRLADLRQNNNVNGYLEFSAEL